MKPFDDTLPEEQEEQHKELITLLHQAYQQSFATTADAQTQAIERVGKRLATLGEDIAFSDSQETLSEPLPIEQASSLREPEMMRDKSGHKKRAMHFINMLAAVLMVGLLVSGAVALFIQRSQSMLAGPAGPVGTPVTTRVEAGGLEMTLSVTPGPYFLSELIMADMSLTNHSHTTFLVRSGGACGLETYLVQTGGESPHYSLPLHGNLVFFGCHIHNANLEPGQTFRNRQYEPLAGSGLVTLIAQAHIMQSDTYASSPLDGHWPSLQIQVASHIPSDRLLALHLKGSQVTIDAPSTAQLVYRFIESCNSLDVGNFTWEPLSTRVLNIPDNTPGCPAKDVRWQYAVGANGYAIAAGTYPA